MADVFLKIDTIVLMERFSISFYEDEVGRQLDDREKVIKRLILKPFDPRDGKEFEDWIDEAVVQILC